MAPARDRSAAAAEAWPRVCHAAGILGWQLVARTLMIRPSYVPRDDSCSGVPITEAFRATAGKWLEASLEARWSPRRKKIAGWRVGASPLPVSSASRCPRGEPAKHSLASNSAGLMFRAQAAVRQGGEARVAAAGAGRGRGGHASAEHCAPRARCAHCAHCAPRARLERTAARLFPPSPRGSLARPAALAVSG